MRIRLNSLMSYVWLYQCFDRIPYGTREYRYLAELVRNPLPRYWKPKGRGRPSLLETDGWAEEADQMLAEHAAGHSAVTIGLDHDEMLERTVQDWMQRRRKMLNR